MRRRRVAAVLVAGGALFLAFGSPVRAQTPGTISFGADPAPGSPSHDGYFSFNLNPGDAATASLRLSNSSDKTAELRVAPVDASTGAQGGTAFSADNAPPTLDGTWVSLNIVSVVLPAQSEKIIPFTVRVPAGARPGVHLAGIAVFAPDQTTQQSVKTNGGAGAALFVESRRVVAVQVTLPGPQAPELVITGVTTIARPNGLNALVAITNRGFGLTKGTGHLQMSGPLETSSDFPIDTFVPGTSITYPVLVSTSPPSGTYHVHVTIVYDGGAPPATYDDAALKVGATEQAGLRNRQVPVPGQTAPSKTGGKGGIPLTALVVGLGAGALIFWVLPMVLRRRRARDQHRRERDSTAP